MESAFFGLLNVGIVKQALISATIFLGKPNLCVVMEKLVHNVYNYLWDVCFSFVAWVLHTNIVVLKTPGNFQTSPKIYCKRKSVHQSVIISY